MSELTQAQKDLLDKHYEQGAFSIVQLPAYVLNELEELFDHETLWQNVANYLMDRLMDLSDHTYDRLTKKADDAIEA